MTGASSEMPINRHHGGLTKNQDSHYQAGKKVHYVEFNLKSGSLSKLGRSAGLRTILTTIFHYFFPVIGL